MGNTGTKLPVPLPEMPYFLIMLQPPNRMKVALADEDTIKVILRVCQETWAQGLQSDHRTNRGVHKLKFIGCPFAAPAPAASISSKNLITTLLYSLYDHGWTLVVSSELSRGCYACTMFFHRNSRWSTSEVHQGRRKSIFCFSMPEPDRIQLINADESVKEITLKTANEICGQVIEEELERDHCYELVFREEVWTCFREKASGSGGLNVSIEPFKLLYRLIGGFVTGGYQFYGSVDVGDRGKGCIFFVGGRPVQEFREAEKLSLLSLIDEDRLVLVEADRDIVDATRATIMDNWPGGIQLEERKCGCTMFKIKGQPWRSTGPDVVVSHRFIANLFRTFLTHGWHVDQSIRIGQWDNAYGYPTFILRPSSMRTVPHACLNLNALDKMRIIGDASLVLRHQSAASLPASPHDMTFNTMDPFRNPNKSGTKLRRRHSSSSRRRLAKSVKETFNTSSRPPLPRLLITPPSDEHLANPASQQTPQTYLELIRIVRNTVEKYWPYGIDRERDYYGCREFRLQGSPWSPVQSSGGNRSLVARVMMCHVLKSLQEAGWTVYASASIASSSKSHQEEPSDVLHGMGTHSETEVHSWFIVLDERERLL